MSEIAANPRMAPTTMKTVPSGRVDGRMNGASAVGGTEGATITNAPAKVGRSLGSENTPVDPPPVIMATEDIEEAEEPAPVMTGIVVFVFVSAAVVWAVLLVPVGVTVGLLSVAVGVLVDFAVLVLSDKFGSLEEVSCAEAVMANMEMATAESSGRCKNFMLSV